MADSLHDLSVDLRRLQRSLAGEGLSRVTEAAALASKKEALAEAKRVAGTDMRLHNWGRRGLKLGAGYDLLQPGQAVLKLRPRGPWVVMDRGASPHVIPKRKRKKRPVLRFDGRWVTGPVRHPGSRGKGAVRNVIRRAEKVVPQAVAKELVLVVREAV